MSAQPAVTLAAVFTKASPRTVIPFPISQRFAVPDVQLIRDAPAVGALNVAAPSPTIWPSKVAAVSAPLTL
jgi:hypothetical protein